MNEELPLEEKPQWTVEPVFKRQSKAEKKANVEPEIKHHALRYGGVTQTTAEGTAEVKKLRATAEFLNYRKLGPRDRIQCVADMPAHPVQQLKKSERAKATPPGKSKL